MAQENVLINSEQKMLILNASPNTSQLTLPYVLNNVVLLTPGFWNGYVFASEDIKNGFELTDWKDKKNFELIKDHADKPLSVDSFVGYAKEIRLSKDGEIDYSGKVVPKGSLVGNLELWDEGMITKLVLAKAKFGVSAKVKGYEDSGVFKIQSFNNFSIVDNPACKNAYINLSDNTEVVKLAETTSSSMPGEAVASSGLEPTKVCDKCKKTPCECKVEDKKLEEDEEEIEEEEDDSTVTEEPELEELKEDSKLLKGGSKEEQKMEMAKEQEQAVSETKVEVEQAKAEEVKAPEATAELSAVLSKIEELSLSIKAIAERVDKVEKLSQKTETLSDKKEKSVEGIIFKIGKPMTVQELSQSKDNRHSAGILAMASHIQALQNK
jgi:hypothetical protein